MVFSWRESISLKEFAEVGGLESDAEVERAELSVRRAGFVEAHLVNEFLGDYRIVGEKIDAPFPIVESDRAGNNLRHFTGEAPPDQAVVVHEALAILERQAIPVVGTVALLVHRIETQVWALGDFREQARRNLFALARKLGFDLRFPLRRIRRDPLLD